MEKKHNLTQLKFPQGNVIVLNSQVTQTWDQIKDYFGVATAQSLFFKLRCPELGKTLRCGIIGVKMSLVTNRIHWLQWVLFYSVPSCCSFVPKQAFSATSSSGASIQIF